ncbi:putative sulfate exporter family transporter [Chitinophaga pendula]|uniref:YeiH family protein n=1 Tax=Chitinophaga TaxID=79328 RepID=UPI000BAECE67|nr:MULTISPECIES: putative sulfate exporter family transporter [Chitinophaga]ASZ13124.1 putative sulfate exporter family transporter [Chitinophaga sp. MD30]UCJ09250.1 putative sulfate exporter family transporter [Chitinophaga pendula]
MPRQPLHEDWIAVIVAFLTIGLVCAGLKPTLPKFGWNSMETLSAQLFQAQTWIQAGTLLLWVLGGLFIARLLAGQRQLLPLIPSLVAIMAISLLAQIITSNKAVKDLGIEVVLFSLLLGLFIKNVLGVPEWMKPAIQTELYIKIGLVLLGANVIFKDILQAGALGILQSVVVVFTVWYFTFWLCKRLGLDDEFRMMISSAVSICGVSAAIATSGAIEGDNKKLSHVISLVLIVAIPMMLFMPYLATWAGMSPAVAGAWLGGTIDTSGAVVAAGTMLGEEALKYATLVKFSQNVLLGLAAFFISVYWSYTKKETATEKPGLRTIWERFPKFVLGFVMASLLFSFALPPEVVSAAKGSLKELQTYWFALAFTCIGLETKFTDIFSMENGRPAIAFIVAQLFNIIFTLIISYLVFDYLAAA